MNLLGISLSRLARTVLCILAVAAAIPAAAGTLTGVVHNGTSGAVVPRQDVVLIQLQGGMQPVQTVQTDAQGRYNFDRPDIGQAPMLVRVTYRGVNYNQSVPPGKSTADIEVFEPTASFASLALVNHAIIVRPDSTTLVVGEEFSIHNLSNPPATYFSTDGTFEFSIPDGATLREVSAAGPAGMPLTEGTIDKGKNHYAVAFALKPGENTIRVSYELPYNGTQGSLKVLTPMAAQRVILAGPTGVQLSSDGFAPAGNEQGYTFYSRDGVAASTPVVVAVAGVTPPTAAGGAADSSDSSATSSDSGAAGRGSGSAAAETSNIAVYPPRLASVQWVLLAGFTMLFALGVFYLWRQPRGAAANAVVDTNSAAAGQRLQHAANPKQDRALAASQSVPNRSGHGSLSARQPVPAATQVECVTANELNREVNLNIDQLKDALFRVELRRQAGTISEEDYARERARLEAILRDLVRP